MSRTKNDWKIWDFQKKFLLLLIRTSRVAVDRDCICRKRCMKLDWIFMNIVSACERCWSIKLRPYFDSNRRANRKLFAAVNLTVSWYVSFLQFDEFSSSLFNKICLSNAILWPCTFVRLLKTIIVARSSTVYKNIRKWSTKSKKNIQTNRWKMSNSWLKRKHKYQIISVETLVSNLLNKTLFCDPILRRIQTYNEKMSVTYRPNFSTDA